MGYFDTAPLYGHDQAEIRLGRALCTAKKPYVLSTKVGRVLNATTNADVTWFADANPNLEPVYDYSEDGIKRSIEDSLNRLGVDHIDIALMHDAEDHLSEAIHNAYPVLDDLRSQEVFNSGVLANPNPGAMYEYVPAPAVTTVLTGSRNKTELLSNIEDFDRELPTPYGPNWKNLASFNRLRCKEQK